MKMALFFVIWMVVAYFVAKAVDPWIQNKLKAWISAEKEEKEINEK